MGTNCHEVQVHCTLYIYMQPMPKVHCTKFNIKAIFAGTGDENGDGSTIIIIIVVIVILLLLYCCLVFLFFYCYNRKERDYQDKGTLCRNNFLCIHTCMNIVDVHNVCVCVCVHPFVHMHVLLRMYSDYVQYVYVCICKYWTDATLKLAQNFHIFNLPSISLPSIS